MSLPYPAWNVVYGEQPTAAKWSELGANDDALAAGTGLASNAVSGSNIASYSTHRSNNGSVLSETTAKVQTGWIAFQPGVTSSATTAVTFPVAFTNVPIITTAFSGDSTGVTSTLGQGINAKQAYAGAISATTSGFSAYVATRDSSSYAAGNTVYVSWIAVGV